LCIEFNGFGCHGWIPPRLPVGLIRADYRPSWAVLPRAEGIILWRRNTLPQKADDILSLAHQYYGAAVAAR
jgi:hypothetical protein